MMCLLIFMQEPTLEGQGGVVGTLAALAAYYSDTGPLDSCSLDLGWSHPNATVGAKSVVNTANCGSTSAAGR